jgi:beta-galactosidase
MKTILSALIILINGSFAAEPSARIVRPLDTGWKFYKGDVVAAQEINFDDKAWRAVTTPHDWSIEGPYDSKWASGTGYLPAGIGWYRKAFTLEPAYKDKCVTVEFEGVYRDSEVWLNGQLLGKRPYGYISFQYDLTPYVNFDGKPNILAVRVDHTDFADSRWYTGSGIYRPVRLYIKDKLHIAHWGVFVTTPKITRTEAEIRIQTEIENRDKTEHRFEIVSEIISPQNNSVATMTTSGKIVPGKNEILIQTIKIPNPQPWSTDSPLLYKLISRINVNSKTLDSQTAPFGVREFRFDADKGFFLNGENMKLKGVCVHHDAGPVGAAVPVQMWQRRLRLLKEIGCNAIRMSHNPPDPALLDLCDQMGFVVMDEAFDEFTPPKKKWVTGWNAGTPSRKGYGEVFAEWSVRDIEDMVRRDRNHPSIILWSIGNEIDYKNDPFTHPVLGSEFDPNSPPAQRLVTYGKPLVAAVKALDSSRPVTAALATAPMSNAVGFADILDVVGYNYQEQYYVQDHKTYPKRILLGSENSMSYDAWKAVTDNDYISGQFLWLGFDFLGEARGWPDKASRSGLFDLCGYKKPIGWFRQSLWSDKPMVYLGASPARSQQQEQSRRGPRNLQESWNWPEGSNSRVTCFSNCQKAELFLNDKSLGEKSLTDFPDRRMNWEVPYQPGILKAVGKNDGKAVCEYILQTAGPAKKIMLKLDSVSRYPGTKDTFQLEISVADEKGTLVPGAENEITLTIAGPARLLGFGSGDNASHDNETDAVHKVYQGRALAVVQSDSQSGEISVKATSPDLDQFIVSMEKK